MLSRIEIIDTETGKLHAILKGHVSQPIDLHFTADGGFLISGGWDGRLLIWDSVRGRELLGLDGFGGSLQISADSDRFSFGSGHDSQMWRLISSEQCRSFTTSIEDSSVCSADITADGRYLGAATGIGVRVWETATGKQFCFLSVPAARSVLFGQDETRLFVSTATGVQSWKLADLAGRKDPVLPSVDANGTSAMAITADGKMVVSGASDGSLFWGDLVEPAVGKILGRHRAPPRYVSINPDGAFAASSSRREKRVQGLGFKKSQTRN